MTEDIEVKKSTWADEVDEDTSLPAPLVTENADGTKTVVTYRIDLQTGKKIKIIQKIREVKIKERVNAAVAERKKWAKYGAEKGIPAGPAATTTTVGENIPFKLGLKSFKPEEEKEKSVKESLGDAKITCRICGGEHFTSKCPYKGALGPADGGNDSEPTSRLGTPQPDGGPGGPGGLGGSAYVPPHLRNKVPGSVSVSTDRGGFPERDDSATLRVSNLSEDVIEDELRALFGRFGTIQRCHLVKDRETGRNRGFAFISFNLKSAAEVACEKMNGFGLDNLIMRVEFSKK